MIRNIAMCPVASKCIANRWPNTCYCAECVTARATPQERDNASMWATLQALPVKTGWL